jgi:multicomponent Na+:H+ antiporter subunit G
MTATFISLTLMGCGLFILGVATFGIFRFDDVFNRIHVAAKCDTMGAILFLSGLVVLEGVSFITFKLVLIILFQWLTNPVAIHFVAETEFRTATDLEDRCMIIDNRFTRRP